jgi:hypothetical protein
MDINIKEDFEGKLNDYKEVEAKVLKKGNHFRYSSSVYKQPKQRKISYGVVQKVNNDGSLLVNSYGEKKFADWKIEPNHKYKKYRFYVKKEIPFTGSCIDCSSSVEEPWIRCMNCNVKRKAEHD